MPDFDDEKLKKGALNMAFNAGNNAVIIVLGDNENDKPEARRELKGLVEQMSDFLEAAKALEEADLFSKDEEMKLALLVMETIIQWFEDEDDELEEVMIEGVRRITALLT